MWLTPASASAAGGPNNPSWVTFYVEVESVDAFVKRAEKMGAKTIMPPSDVAGGPRLAIFTDPEGHIFGMTQAGSM